MFWINKSSHKWNFREIFNKIKWMLWICIVVCHDYWIGRLIWETGTFNNIFIFMVKMHLIIVLLRLYIIVQHFSSVLSHPQLRWITNVFKLFKKNEISNYIQRKHRKDILCFLHLCPCPYTPSESQRVEMWIRENQNHIYSPVKEFNLNGTNVRN